MHRDCDEGAAVDYRQVAAVRVRTFHGAPAVFRSTGCRRDAVVVDDRSADRDSCQSPGHEVEEVELLHSRRAGQVSVRTF